ncbi:MAG: hypothetical protein NT149_01830 [Candidatus Gottesmanbacteria bacterium]|nr:hypothetical protein [Candidatus Gottesmanbacteria bacterium]
MEVNNSQPVNPPEIPAQPQPVQPPVNNRKVFFPIILGGIVLLLVVGGGAYYLGTQQNNNSPTTNPLVTPEPTATDQTSPSVNPTSNVNQPTQKPTASNKTVIVPSNWKQFTATDTDFGVKTTISMPPGYSFRFTGSEFTIQNDSDATELWDYSSSVYRDNDGVLKNHYDGSSRRAWYEKRLSERQSTDKIISVKEIPLNSFTYLELTVQTPSYDDHGVVSGTKNGMHYVYVQNNILHMITPVSNKAYTSAAQIPNNIEPILASLSSVQTK